MLKFGTDWAEKIQFVSIKFETFMEYLNPSGVDCRMRQKLHYLEHGNNGKQNAVKGTDILLYIVDLKFYLW